MHMQRQVVGRVSAALVALGTATSAHAQTRQPSPPPPPIDYSIAIGALGGLTRSTIKGDAGTNESVDPRTGFMGGIWVAGNYNSRIGFSAEASYVMKGANEAGGPGEFKIAYLEVPGLIRVNVGPQSRAGARAYAVAGPVVGVTLTATLDGDDVTDDYKKFDVGLLGGAGVEVRRFGAEVRANWGLTAIFDPGEGGEKVKNFTIQIVGKYRFK
jgi:hypothetical protein